MTLINPGGTRTLASYQCASLWYMLAPPVGTFNVVVTFPAAMDGETAGAVSLWNVKPGAPDVSATGNSLVGAATTNITTLTANSTLVDIFGSNQAIGNLAPLATQTLRGSRMPAGPAPPRAA